MNTLLQLLGLNTEATVDEVHRWHWQTGEAASFGLFYGILIVGLVLAAVNFLPQIRMRRGVRITTFFLRLAMVGLLLVVLEQGGLYLDLRVEEPARWLALVDDSASMSTADVQGKPRFAAAVQDARQLRSTIGDRVDLALQTLSGAPLGEAAGPGPTFLQRAVMQHVLAGERTDQLILLTDGRDTEGWDFTTLGQDLKAHGTALAVRLYGTDTVAQDASLAAAPERPVLRLGEDLVVRGAVSGPTHRAAGIVLHANDKAVKRTAVAAGEDRTFTLVHPFKKPGRYFCAVKLEGDDLVRANNEVRFVVQVVESRIQVLLMEGFPRFEFKFLRAILDVDPLVDLVSVCHIPGGGVYVQGDPLHDNPQEGLITSQAELFKYDVVILRDIPRTRFRAGGDVSETRLRNLVEFVRKRGGGLVVLGGKDVYRAGGYENSPLNAVLPFDLSPHFSKQAQFPGTFFVSIPKAAYVHPILQLFAEPDRTRERLNALRELDGSNNVGRFKPLATPLMTRFVELPDGKGATEQHEVPILGYQAMGDGKVVAAAVDTLWRWQLQPDFEDPPLEKLLANLVRYIAPPPGQKPGAPTVRLTDASPQVGQEVLLSSVLKDKNYDPITNADLQVSVIAPDKSERLIWPRDLPETPGYYEYRVRVDQPGPYTVRARYGKQEQETCFVAGAAGGEFANPAADRAAMDQLARAAGGRVVDDLTAWLRQAGTAPSLRPETHEIAVWNSPGLLVLFLLLICADCFVRKRQGLA